MSVNDISLEWRRLGKTALAWPAADNSADGGAWQGPLEDWANLAPVIERACAQRRVAVQAGGCLGMYPLFLAEMFDLTYAFEPDPINFFIMSINLRERPDVFKINAALSDSAGVVNVTATNPSNFGMRVIDANGSCSGSRAFCIRLDALQLDQVDLLMLDIEGHERAALAGAAETIRRCRPLIVVEHKHDSGLVDKICSLYNYSIVDIQRHDAVLTPAEKEEKAC